MPISEDEDDVRGPFASPDAFPAPEAPGDMSDTESTESIPRPQSRRVIIEDVADEDSEPVAQGRAVDDLPPDPRHTEYHTKINSKVYVI